MAVRATVPWYPRSSHSAGFSIVLRPTTLGTDELPVGRLIPSRPQLQLHTACKRSQARQAAAQAAYRLLQKSPQSPTRRRPSHSSRERARKKNPLCNLVEETWGKKRTEQGKECTKVFPAEKNSSTQWPRLSQPTPPSSQPHLGSQSDTGDRGLSQSAPRLLLDWRNRAVLVTSDLTVLEEHRLVGSLLCSTAYLLELRNAGVSCCVC